MQHSSLLFLLWGGVTGCKDADPVSGCSYSIIRFGQIVDDNYFDEVLPVGTYSISLDGATITFASDSTTIVVTKNGDTYTVVKDGTEVQETNIITTEYDSAMETFEKASYTFDNGNCTLDWGNASEYYEGDIFTGTYTVSDNTLIITYSGQNPITATTSDNWETFELGALKCKLKQ